MPTTPSNSTKLKCSKSYKKPNWVITQFGLNFTKKVGKYVAFLAMVAIMKASAYRAKNTPMNCSNAEKEQRKE